MNHPKIFKQDLSQEQLELYLKTCQHDTTGGDLAVDCEMMGLNPHRDRLCLVQMADKDNNISLIQIAQNQTEAPNLKALLEHSNITKLFHYGRTDVAYLSHYLNIKVNPVFCTKIASKLARTYTERHGLREVVRELLNIDLNKQQQSSDWGADTLTKDQIDYASSDVLYLIRAKAILIKMLEREGRLELANQCFQQVNLMAELDNLGYEFLFEHRTPK